MIDRYKVFTRVPNERVYVALDRCDGCPCFAVYYEDGPECLLGADGPGKLAEIDGEWVYARPDDCPLRSGAWLLCDEAHDPANALQPSLVEVDALP